MDKNVIKEKKENEINVGRVEPLLCPNCNTFDISVGSIFSTKKYGDFLFLNCTACNFPFCISVRMERVPTKTRKGLKDYIRKYLGIH